MGPEDLKDKPEAVLNHHLEISKQTLQNLRDMVRKLRAGQSAGADEGALLIQKLADDHRVTYNQMMDIFRELAATKLHL
ncbi:unnamed protein product [Tilletia laevis]|nr:unnamed protein product [Tilletia caries]CAD6900875.1 unnamed protein product [Tilletia controversa]CAD6934124.1 unnamed protein product [Tilletia laevis]CAD6930471.1 unnamed protein product [Tilletia caries]CAD6948959.1 unnamed protein product [Tilletia laevis]